MSDTSRPVTIQILDKEYVVSCPREEEDSLLTAAQLLNSQMQQIRDSGKIIGAERIAVMAALNIANLRLLYTRISVPDNGGAEQVVGERFVDEGALLAANTPIVSILNIRRLIAVIHVIEKDYFKIKPGQQAMITTDALPGKTFSGKVWASSTKSSMPCGHSSLGSRKSSRVSRSSPSFWPR